jgi:hypothetical protein
MTISYLRVLLLLRLLGSLGFLADVGLEGSDATRFLRQDQCSFKIPRWILSPPEFGSCRCPCCCGAWLRARTCRQPSGLEQTLWSCLPEKP